MIEQGPEEESSVLTLSDLDMVGLLATLSPRSVIEKDG